MKIVDVNILLYAVNPDTPHHDRIVEWWEEQLNGDESIGLAWTVAVGFLRISTHPRIFPCPLTPEEAIGQLDVWLALDIVSLLTENRDHWRTLRGHWLTDVGVAGRPSGVADAHLAALALTHWHALRWHPAMPISPGSGDSGGRIPSTSPRE